MKNNLDSSYEKSPEFTRWKKREGDLSIFELQDFDKFLRAQHEYSKSVYATHQMRHEDPLQITFFGEGDETTDSVFELINNRDDKTFEVTCTKGEDSKLNQYLEKYGFEKV